MAHREPTTKAPSRPLAGKVFDESGESLYAQGAAKDGRRYRYFVSVWTEARPQTASGAGGGAGA